MRLTPRNLAKGLGAKYYHGKMCRLGHGTLRYTSTGHCTECSAIQGAKYYAANGAHMKANHEIWRKKNAGKANAKNRKSQLKNRTPPWADLKAMRDIYEAADRISKTTGTKHVVDHIIPVNGRKVCGLHVESNLQILTLAANLRKLNHFRG